MSSTPESRSEGFHALGIWVLVYVAASFASLVVLAISGQESGQDIPMWVLAMNVLAMW